ncbi:MAG: isochorismatase [Candidatus Binatia bacterium]|nr:MAG: isochorismatase [Candidatus Binatia bacterium]
MLPTLPALVSPRETALLVMECQRGVLEPEEDRFRALADAVAKQGTVEHIRRLVAAARTVGTPVVFLTASRRADRKGSAFNCPLLAAGSAATSMVPGSDRHAMVPGLEPRPEDFVVDRMHGVSPFHSTGLDPLLRNLGVRTVVATGVSVNVGILGLVLEAVNFGYYAVIPRDAVAGVPEEYVDQVFRFTLRHLAIVTTVDAIVDLWQPPGPVTNAAIKTVSE